MSDGYRECLACHGAGFHDHKWDDAFMEEHLTPGALAEARAAAEANGRVWGGRTGCEECDSTGVITEERWRDLMAAARAAVDQIVAKIEHEEPRS